MPGFLSLLLFQLVHGVCLAHHDLFVLLLKLISLTYVEGSVVCTDRFLLGLGLFVLTLGELLEYILKNVL